MRLKYSYLFTSIERYSNHNDTYMKKLIFALTLILFASNIYCQVNRYDKPADANFNNTYVSPDYDAILNAGLKKQAHYDRNKKQIDNLINWIFELKLKTDDKQFHASLDSYYKNLMSFDGKDLTLYDNQIRNIDLGIKEEIDKYNTRAKEENNPEQYWSLANEQMNTGKYQEAIVNYDKVIALAPEFGRSYLNRGFCFQKTGLSGAALIDYNKFISLEPNDPYGYFYRAWLHHSQEDYSEAISDFDNYLKLKPEDAEGYSSRGWAKYYNKDYMGALSDFNKQIELDESNPIAYYNRGSAKSELNDHYGAISDYKKAIELDKTFSMAYNNMAWSKFNLKKYNDALIDANKAIELDKENQVAYDSRAEIKFNLKDYNGCIEDANTALSLNPKISNAYFMKARASYRLGRKRDACEFWSKAGELGKAEAYEYITKYCNN
jgi:tetratricopeptide (TPR) repeat protein